MAAVGYDSIESINGQVFRKQYDYTQYSHENHVNVIPENDFKHLVEDTFRTITDTMRATYGPYGSTVVISAQNETMTTKDGYNVFEAMGFSHAYKRMVYLAIQKICERVNRNVGDGTTSCILLAEKMFKTIERCIKTPDDKRSILSVLTRFEQYLQETSIFKDETQRDGMKKLTLVSLKGMLNLAGNYDKQLSDVIMKALDPQVDNDGNVTNVRNVVVEQKLDIGGDSITTYDVNYLPGNYRIRVNMGVEQGLLFEQPRKIRVALYDHKFSASDWNFFMESFDKETETLILARAIDAGVMDNEYVRYCKQRAAVNQPIKIIFAEIKGNYFKHEVADLAAMLQIEPIGLHAKAVDHEALPNIPIQVFKGNCMCFFTEYIPAEYIEVLKEEMEKELTDSLAMRTDYLRRIKALSNQSQDTMVIVRSGTSLELKMISDKIDDCISIVQSALSFGVVPNMLVFGYKRVYEFKTDSDLGCLVRDAIMESIIGLFHDIWESKHSDNYLDKRDAIAGNLYDLDNWDSFDIIKERFVDGDKLPTSAQYDLEVISASISIVKYLLTSRALVFDAHLMTPVNDVGSYREV